MDRLEEERQQYLKMVEEKKHEMEEKRKEKEANGTGTGLHVEPL